MASRSSATPFRARIRGRLLDASRSPLIMGIVNVTPDSFHDGGRYRDTRSAVRHAAGLIESGSHILDIGGESTRPGAAPVTEREELRRVIPVIRGIRRRDPGIAISIDTMKAAVAKAALEAGADIVNDVSGLSADPAMAAVCANARCPVVIMHRRGSSERMYDRASYRDVSRDVARELKDRVRAALAAGIRPDRIVLDPGVGFAKKAPDSWRLLLNLKPILRLGYPVLCGWSRKSFLKEIAGDSSEARLAGTLALIGPVVVQGVSILRVHDVPETAAVLEVLQAIENAKVS